MQKSESSASPAPTIWHRYRPLLRYALTDVRGWALIIGFTALSSSVAVLQPWPMKLLIDHVLGNEPPPEWLSHAAEMLPGLSTRQGLLAWVAAAGLIFFLLNSAMEVILTFGWIRVGQRMVYALAADMFSNMQRRSLLFHRRSTVGDLMGRITTDSWCIYKIVDVLLFAPGRALVLLAGMAVVMWRADWLLTLVSLGVLPFMAFSSRMFGKPIRAAARARRDIESRLQAHVHQVLVGIPVIQAFSQEQCEQSRFRGFIERAVEAHRRSTLLGSFSGLCSGLTTVIGSAIVLWIGTTRVLDGSLTLGALLIFLSYLTTLQGQLRVFTGIYAALQEQGASVDRVLEVLHVEPEVRQRADAVPLAKVRGHVRLENVEFGYEPGHPVLKQITLDIQPGEVVALVGETGAGKSTLAALVPRLLDPWQGRVSIDGQDLRDSTISSVRDQISLVLQDPFVFPTTIAENLCYGRPDATRDQIESAARAAHAHGFISQLPGGYDHVLGDRAATLSGGERQRLSIARAILRDAPILILDEPTSSLDAESEALVLDALYRLMRGRTTLIIAHRFSTIGWADRIVVLNRGQVAEQGTHADLIEAHGKYWSLYNHHQAGGAQRSGLGVMCHDR